MSNKAKPTAAAAALASLPAAKASKAPRVSLRTSTPAKTTRPRKGVRVSEDVISKPTALNLYPVDMELIDKAVTYLRSKGCQGVSKSRVAQLAIRELKFNEETVTAFEKLPDYRNKNAL